MGTITAGAYLVKLKMPYFLIKQIPGIHNISSGQTYNLTRVTMYAGDANQDNKIDLSDYNSFISCYKENQLVSNQCQPEDLNDDGYANQFDYNIFLRFLAATEGD
jgi:hypothetical protein